MGHDECQIDSPLWCQHLLDHVKDFEADSCRSKRRYWHGKYMKGMLQEGIRKLIGQLAANV